MLVVEAMNGPLDGKRWPFSREITVGRDATAVTAALPTDRAVSRRHAIVRSRTDGFELEDLGSSNGTYLDGKLVESRARLAVGQPFVVGRTMLCVIEAEDSNAD